MLSSFRLAIQPQTGFGPAFRFSLTCLRASRTCTHHLLPCIRRRATVADSIKMGRCRRPVGHCNTHSARAQLAWCQLTTRRAKPSMGFPRRPRQVVHPPPHAAYCVCICVPWEAFWLPACTLCHDSTIGLRGGSKIRWTYYAELCFSEIPTIPLRGPEQQS